ncbi:hypothetical protein KIPB_005371, partial [Kipferlia bialata]
ALPILGGAAHSSSLRHLNLGDNGLDHGVVGEVATVLARSNLESLNLANNHIGPLSAEDLAVGVAACPSLAALDLGGCRLEHFGLVVLTRAFIETRESLRSLVLTDNMLASNAIYSLSEYLVGAQHLRVLRLNRNPISSSGASLLAKSLAGLGSDENLAQGMRTRERQESERGALEGMECTGKDIDRDLEVLDLRTCRIGDKGALDIARVCGRLTRLHTLHLSDNYIGEEAGAKLVELLKPSRSLLHISVKGNQFSYVTVEALRKLCLRNKDTVSEAHVAELKERLAGLREKRLQLAQVQRELGEERAGQEAAREVVEIAKDKLATSRIRMEQEVQRLNKRIEQQHIQLQALRDDLTRKHQEMQQLPIIWKHQEMQQLQNAIDRDVQDASDAAAMEAEQTQQPW